MLKHGTAIDYVVALAASRGLTARRWDPVTGCRPASEGCRGCWSAANCHVRGQQHSLKMQARYGGLTTMRPNGLPAWTGEVRENADQRLLPLTARRPTLWVVGFDSDVGLWSSEMLSHVFAIAWLRPDHIFLLLTKRPDRLRDYFLGPRIAEQEIGQAVHSIDHGIPDPLQYFHLPLKNVWLGCTVENQHRADERRAAMAELDGAGWSAWASHEPALGCIDWTGWEFLDWLVTGGESGRDSRPMHPDWARADRDWCAVTGRPWWFKQWGDWWPYFGADDDMAPVWPDEDGLEGVSEQGAFPRGVKASGDSAFPRHAWPEESDVGDYRDGIACSYRVGKKAAGHLLDGREHRGVPEWQG